MMVDREARLAELRSEISARLRPLCQHWPQEMFEEMVHGLAALTFKYETSPPVYDPAPTEKMIADLKSIAAESAELREKTDHPQHDS
jgi:hypothetical protein